MTATVAIRKAPDGKIVARRLDGQPMTEADRAEARALAAQTDETVVAILIDSTVLGAPIWFALRDGWKPDAGDTTPVFYADELPGLRSVSPERLRFIYEARVTFDGGKVIK